uniref:HTH_48 domain-containing protein n=1 Tax=Strongyloides stercoralis TaxID=6248 RepID=A0A0K0DS35_STRER
MLEKKQIRTIFLYEFKLGHSAVEAARNINAAFGQGTTTKRTTQRWFKKFREGDESLEEEEGRGRKSVVDNSNLRVLVERNSRTTIRELANELEVSHPTVLDHLNQLGKVKKLDKYVPHELSEKQKRRRYEVSYSLLLRHKSDPFLNRIVTCDEKWILYDNRHRSSQWLDKDEAPKTFPKPMVHQKKVMVIVWWCRAGLIDYSFLKPGETMAAERYCSEIDKMHEKLQRMCPALIKRRRPLLLHDNARPHVSQMTLQKLNALEYETLPHPPYSPDLSPTDYHFFKHLNNFLKEKIFTKQEDAENAFRQFIDSREPDFYITGINKLVDRWQQCVDSDGFYFD